MEKFDRLAILKEGEIYHLSGRRFRFCPGGIPWQTAHSMVRGVQNWNRTNNNIQPFLELLQRLSNWLLDWPTTKQAMSLRYSVLPGFVNVKVTVHELQCSEDLWDFCVWLSQTSSLWSLVCHKEWLHPCCEQVQALCCCGAVQVAIIPCHLCK